MTQPSLNTTFDTSLVDLRAQNPSNINTSFSTTETDPSESGQGPIDLAAEKPYYTAMESTTLDNIGTLEPQPTPSSKPIVTLSNIDLYNRWADIYDTNGNFLQAVDDYRLATLLPKFLDSIPIPSSRLRILDMGCGTGRNTLKMVAHNWSKGTSISVTGIDPSFGMLEGARRKLPASLPTGIKIRLLERLATPALAQDPELDGLQDAVISTLVLEHMPLADFFGAVTSALKEGGKALVTNMHAEMGAKTQANYRIVEDGKMVKVQGTSYVHTVEESIDAAEKAGCQVLEVWEQAVTQGMLDTGVVSKERATYLGVKVWYGMVLRKCQGS